MGSSNLGAVIVEPRKHPALKFVIQNMRKYFSWPILLIHGTLNEDWAKQQVIGIPNLTIKNCKSPNLSPVAYSNYLTTVAFWGELPFEKILIFQTDTLLLRTGIQSYLSYDYIGAPWSWNRRVGNGGMSLRSKNAMITAIKENQRSKRHPEDLFFSNYFYRNPKRFKLAPFEIARSFSIESVFHPNPLAIHKCWKHMRGKNWDLLVRKYPDISHLRQLNGFPWGEVPHRRPPFRQKPKFFVGRGLEPKRSRIVEVQNRRGAEPKRSTPLCQKEVAMTKREK